MKFILIVALALGESILPINSAHAQTAAPSTRTAAQTAAIRELNSAALAYREGEFTEAQIYSQRALNLDPDSKNAYLFLARTIHAQYKPGDSSETNAAKAREAITAYQQILNRFADEEEAYKAIAYLYGSLKEEELLREWVLKRAANSSFEPEKRAEAYIQLASKDWDCSFKITELPTSKNTTVVNNKTVVHYLRPPIEADFTRASQCVENGLRMVEMAIALNPESESGWSYKTNLLLESTKLAEMEDDLIRKQIVLEQYEEALRQTQKAAEKAKNQTP